MLRHRIAMSLDGKMILRDRSFISPLSLMIAPGSIKIIRQRHNPDCVVRIERHRRKNDMFIGRKNDDLCTKVKRW